MTRTGAAKVVAYPGLRAKLRSMAATQMRAARIRLGMDHEGFAEYLGSIIDWTPLPETVARWERGTPPPPSDLFLAAVMAAQGVPGGDVLTLAVDASAERQAALMSATGPMPEESKGVTPYPDRGQVTRDQWNGVISDSSHDVWLYGMAEHGYATDDEVAGLMQAAAARGCQVKVLLLSPGYPGIEAIDADEGNPAGTLAARIRASAANFGAMRDECGGKMELRYYDTHPTASVIRGDGRMFVTPYLRFLAGVNSPTWELTSTSANKMFTRYSKHFTSMWETSKE
jgi:Domain of unknown function (DUF5919)